MPEPLKTSVIIPTYNGAHKVVTALDSLLHQSVAPYEVLVVIDGSTDNTKSILESKNYPFQRFKIIEQPNGGRAKVRNRGAKEAEGALLLFLDDDMFVPNEWVEQHLAHHTLMANTILTGKLKDPNADKPQNDFLLYKAWLNDKWNKGLADEEPTKLMDVPYITANNFSISKLLFWKLNGFDERLTDAEDYDLAVRAERDAVPIYFGSLCYAWHHDVTNCRKYIHRLQEYQKAQQKLLALKPELYENNHRYSIKYPLGLKKVLFKLFARNFWLTAIEKEYLKFLPPTIRYRIYDAIITSKGVYNY
jgi:glycosyltransferase involved in cell wall biosynthesis